MKIVITLWIILGGLKSNHLVSKPLYWNYMLQREGEGIVLFNDTQHILFTVIWRRTYGKGPLR